MKALRRSTGCISLSRGRTCRRHSSSPPQTPPVRLHRVSIAPVSFSTLVNNFIKCHKNGSSREILVALADGISVGVVTAYCTGGGDSGARGGIFKALFVLSNSIKTGYHFESQIRKSRNWPLKGWNQLKYFNLKKIDGGLCINGKNFLRRFHWIRNNIESPFRPNKKPERSSTN